MSVINKMLRDLDQRANVSPVSSTPQPMARSSIRGTPDVISRSGGTARRGGYPLALVIGLLGGLAVAGGDGGLVSGLLQKLCPRCTWLKKWFWYRHKLP